MRNEMDYIEKAKEFGFIVVAREDVMTKPQIECYRGAASMTAEQLKTAHDGQDVLLRARIANYEGAYVVFTPEGDHEDFVLVGDDQQALAKVAYEHECEIRFLTPEQAA